MNYLKTKNLSVNNTLKKEKYLETHENVAELKPAFLLSSEIVYLFNNS